MEILLIILAFLFGVAIGAILGYYLLRYIMRRVMQKQAAEVFNLLGSAGPNQNPVTDILNQLMQPQVKKNA